jgi:hypothetical protein
MPPLSPPAGEDMEEIGLKIIKYFFVPGSCYTMQLHWRRTLVQ